MKLYRRAVEVVVGDADGDGIKVGALKIAFEVKHEASSKSAEGFVKIYNLAQDTETRIREKAKRVQIKAGYSEDYLVFTGNKLSTTGNTDGMSLLHDGQVRRVQRTDEGQDRVVHITLGGNVFKTTEAFVNLSYAGAVPVKTIIQDALPSFDMPYGSLDKIPDEQVHDFCFSGRAGDLMNEILRPREVQWYEENGMMQFSKKGEAVHEEVVLLSPDSGLVGSPSVTDKGVKVKALLFPQIQIGSKVQLESEATPETSGTYKVIQVTHKGSNWDGEMVTEFEGVLI